MIISANMKTLKMTKPFLILMMISNFACAQSMESNLSSWMSNIIPDGYTISYFIYCNVNLDNKTDLILVLKEKDTTSTSAVEHEKRPLLIVESDSTGLFHLAQRNDFVIPCLKCGDNHTDPFRGIVPENGSFTINLGGGTSYWWTREITFKYNPKDKQYYYNKDEGKSFYADKAITKNRKTLTAKEFGKILFQDFNFYEFDTRKYDP